MHRNGLSARTTPCGRRYSRANCSSTSGAELQPVIPRHGLKYPPTQWARPRRPRRAASPQPRHPLGACRGLEKNARPASAAARLRSTRRANFSSSDRYLRLRHGLKPNRRSFKVSGPVGFQPGLPRHQPHQTPFQVAQPLGRGPLGAKHQAAPPGGKPNQDRVQARRPSRAPPGCSSYRCRVMDMQARRHALRRRANRSNPSRDPS